MCLEKIIYKQIYKRRLENKCRSQWKVKNNNNNEKAQKKTTTAFFKTKKTG